jgi:hypothetical protein
VVTDMTPHAFEHNEDPYRFIAQARIGILLGEPRQ